MTASYSTEKHIRSYKKEKRSLRITFSPESEGAEPVRKPESSSTFLALCSQPALVLKFLQMQHDTASGPGLRVAIIGGGIAGLSAAAFLRKHAQCSITIYERRDAGFTETSAGIGIMSNGISIVKQLGIHREEVRGVIAAGFRTYNIREEEVSRSLLGDGPDGEGAVWLIFRQDLRDALLRRVGDEKGVGQPVKMVYGSRVVGVDPEAGVVDFADGTSVESDLVIGELQRVRYKCFWMADDQYTYLHLGADGIHSVVRKAVIPSTHPVPAPCGLSMYRFVIPMDIVKNAIGHDHEYPAMYDFSQGTFATIIAAGDQGNRNVVTYPCREHELMNMAFAVPDGSVRDPDQLQYSWNAAGNKEEMLEALRGFPEWLQRIFR